jgi:protein SCO1/2
MNRRVRLAIVLAPAFAAAATVAIAAWLGVRPVPQIATSGLAAVGGPFTLVTADEQSVSDQTYRGKWLVVFFGYTFCPDACPTALNSISVALEALGSDAGRLQPLFVTVDPERDTPGVMAEYLKSFDSRIVGLTGTQAQIDSMVREYRVYATRDKSGTGGADYLVSHSAYIYLIDPQGRFVNIIQGSASGQEIAVWLRKEMNNSKT